MLLRRVPAKYNSRLKLVKKSNGGKQMTAQNSNLDKIEHIVVLMMENRSFDNVLGWLYPDNPDFHGVNSAMSNPRPGGGSACVGKGTDFTAPYPDPNEPYEYVYRQMYNPPDPTLPIPNTTETPDTRISSMITRTRSSIANERSKTW